MIDIKENKEARKELETENNQLKELANELRAVKKQNELKIASDQAKCKALEEKVSQLKESVADLTIKLTEESEALIRIRSDIKQLEKSKTSSQLAYEAQKEQCELTKKENTILVLLAYHT